MPAAVLRSEFASGIVDYPPKKSVVDVEGGLEIARTIEEQSIVLLKNDKSVLPLDQSKLHSIAIIGFNADMGMISGGGSAQVDPPGRRHSCLAVARLVPDIASQGRKGQGSVCRASSSIPVQTPRPQRLWQSHPTLPSSLSISG